MIPVWRLRLSSGSGSVIGKMMMVMVFMEPGLVIAHFPEVNEQ